MRKHFVPSSICFVLALFMSQTLLAQATVPGYHDPALSRNKLLRDQQGDGVYKMISIYKVIGTPYLFGEKHNSNFFSSTEKAQNIDISYNTYSQEIEFFSASNKGMTLVKLPGEVDSFVLKQNLAAGIDRDLKFIYGPLVGSSEKAYLQVITEGKRFSLYKRYKSDLGFVSTNYTQTDLRQFDLIYDYFYRDAQTNSFKKLKFNLKDITKEFKDIKDVSPLADKNAFPTNPEGVVRNIFDYLNE